MRIPGKIPISIHPLFWVTAAIIGWMLSGNISGMIIWIFIIFFSVLIHEFGHALTALCFGKTPKIDLIALGGVTSYATGGLAYWKQFLIVFNGPLFGFLLYVGASLLLLLPLSTHTFLISVIASVKVINFFWTIMNLVPVLPLDGGQLLRIVMEAWLGIKGIRMSFMIGCIIALLISLFFFVIQGFLVGALFFLFAFQSFDTWRKARQLSDPDREDEMRTKMAKAEAAIAEGRKEEAKTLFSEIREHAHQGIIYNGATQYLALILFEEGQRHEAYDLLLKVKDQLAEEAVPALHELAFDEKNYRLVADLSANCYQITPTQDTALRNARAFASLKEPKHSGGWLKTAWNLGNLDVEKILKESIFDPVRQNPEFVALTKFNHK